MLLARWGDGPLGRGPAAVGAGTCWASEMAGLFDLRWSPVAAPHCHHVHACGGCTPCEAFVSGRMIGGAVRHGALVVIEYAGPIVLGGLQGSAAPSPGRSTQTLWRRSRAYPVHHRRGRRSWRRVRIMVAWNGLPASCWSAGSWSCWCWIACRAAPAAADTITGCRAATQVGTGGGGV